jgi:uncharacterized protein YuzB (UPF0349 family)
VRRYAVSGHGIQHWREHETLPQAQGDARLDVAEWRPFFPAGECTAAVFELVDGNWTQLEVIR